MSASRQNRKCLCCRGCPFYPQRADVAGRPLRSVSCHERSWPSPPERRDASAPHCALVTCAHLRQRRETIAVPAMPSTRAAQWIIICSVPSRTDHDHLSGPVTLRPLKCEVNCDVRAKCLARCAAVIAFGSIARPMRFGRRVAIAEATQVSANAAQIHNNRQGGAYRADHRLASKIDPNWPTFPVPLSSESVRMTKPAQQAAQEDRLSAENNSSELAYDHGSIAWR